MSTIKGISNQITITPPTEPAKSVNPLVERTVKTIENVNKLTAKYSNNSGRGNLKKRKIENIVQEPRKKQKIGVEQDADLLPIPKGSLSPINPRKRKASKNSAGDSQIKKNKNQFCYVPEEFLKEINAANFEKIRSYMRYAYVTKHDGTLGLRILFECDEENFSNVVKDYIVDQPKKDSKLIFAETIVVMPSEDRYNILEPNSDSEQDNQNEIAFEKSVSQMLEDEYKKQMEELPENRQKRPIIICKYFNRAIGLQIYISCFIQGPPSRHVCRCLFRVPDNLRKKE